MVEKNTEHESREDAQRPVERIVMRRPLAVGNIYRFKGYKNNGIQITAMSLPGTPTDDGGLPGVAVRWLNRSNTRGWYVFNTEEEFWSDIRFRNAVDPEYA